MKRPPPGWTPTVRIAIVLLPAILALQAILALPAAPATDTRAGSARLTAALLSETPIVADLEELCDRIGGRPTGSAACERSVDWFAARFRSIGADRVWTEPFDMPVRWEEGRSSAEVISLDRLRLRVVAMPFSPGTPKKGLVAKVVPIGNGDAGHFEAAAGRLRGALLLLDTPLGTSWEELMNDYLRMPDIVRRAQDAGAAGILVVGGRPHGLLYRHVATMGTEAPLPMAILAREDGLRLARLAAAGEAVLRLDLDVKRGPAFPSRNVLAEIRGRERPEEIVLAGAHLDSWELGTGALDNGANCAMLLDVARQMAATGLRPRRTVRFVLFTGEEQGMYGSLGYVRTHHDEMDRHVAAVVFDEGTGRITGYSMGGRDVSGYGVGGHTTDAFVGTDNLDFLLEGVPNLVANQDPANYLENYHASSDTFDKADLRELKINAAITAATVWGLADMEGRPPRQDRSQIGDVMERTGLVAQMKLFGLWDAWEKKTRGRPD